MRRPLFWLVAGGVAVFLLSYLSINTDTGSDPRLNLLVSQALVDYHTVYLDNYRSDAILDRPFADYVADATIQETNGHYIHYFPVGPSLLSAPAVALARRAGWDMRTTDNYRLQELLSALTAVLALFLGYALARRFVSDRSAVVIALVSTLGGSLISTLGTALWSHNYAVLFIGGALWLLAGGEHRPLSTPRALLLGALLFLAFLCRATAAAFIAPAFIYLALRQRAALALTAAAALGLLLGYQLLYHHLLGSWLPSYYSPARLTVERAPLWVGVAGNLISPGRGLFVFSPFLLVVLAADAFHSRRLRRQRLVWLCAAWFALHLILIARAASWWGGWSFGPRLLTDIWPGIILLTAIGWAAVTADTTPRRARLWAMAYVGLALPALFIHVVLGLNSQPASRWNGAIDPVPLSGGALGDLFNWRYTQIAASNGMLCQIERESALREGQSPSTLTSYQLGQIIAYNADPISRLKPPPPPADDTAAGGTQDAADSPRARVFLPSLLTPGNIALFIGWAEPTALEGGGGFRWSQCAEAAVHFRLEEPPVTALTTLEIEATSLGRQRVRYSLNGMALGSSEWSGDPGERRAVTFPSELLRPGAVNVLIFEFPDAHEPSLRDQRPLGLALQGLTFHAETPPEPPPSEAYPAP